MITVWKFTLSIKNDFILSMPKDWQPLLVAMQDGNACLWARVNKGAPNEAVRFYCTGTGAPVERDLTHLGSVVAGEFVWHFWVDHPLAGSSAGK